ncbi:MAG: ankyrin repeat domain-containing protein [Candidatus Hydrogenedentes bacterium]|nr:ankyrin repeat domain-containing protein [Candidatus Hydrogenedentota bacterium]
MDKQAVLKTLPLCLAVLLLTSGCNPSIHDAVARQETVSVKKMLDGNPDLVHALDGKKKTPLHAAVTYRKLEVFPILIDYGANINAADITGMTPLHVAGMLGRYEEAKWLLEHNANPLIEDEYGDTPLHTAVVFGHGHIVKLLIENGLSLDRPNGKNEMPVDIAKAYRQQKIKLYLEYLKKCQSKQIPS